MARKIKISPRQTFDLRNMCTPATIYFVISLIGLILVGINNLDNNDKVCVGEYNCYVGNNTTVFIVNAIYILFWTFVLDLMCKAGYSSLSWFILLLPFIILFIVFATLMVKEGNADMNSSNCPDGKKRLANGYCP
jgi:hypothetical protein